jgi:hypothetical protein
MPRRIVLRRRRCLITSLGQRPRGREIRITSAEGAIHEELSYAPAQVSEGNYPSPQSSPRKRGEAQYCMQPSVFSRRHGIDFDERYVWD